MSISNKKPTMKDLVQPRANEKTRAAFLAAFQDAKKEQDALLKRAKKLQ